MDAEYGTLEKEQLYNARSSRSRKRKFEGDENLSFRLSRFIPQAYLRSYRTGSQTTDIHEFMIQTFDELVQLMIEELNRLKTYKARLVLHVVFEKEYPPGVIAKQTLYYFHSPPMTILHESEISQAIRAAQSFIEKRVEWGPTWKVIRILTGRLDIAEYSPLVNSSYTELPTKLKVKRAIVNVKNNDNRCLMWSLLAALHPAAYHAERVNHYAPYQNELKFTNVEFPVSLENISKIEEMNSLAINVFEYDDGLHPVHLTKFEGVKPINLLYIQDSSHYCWIRDYDRLSRSNVHNSDGHDIEQYV